MATDDTFLYFAYGSNLSKARLHINNPSAEFYAVAKLEDYKLVFGRQQSWKSERWHGGVASIEQIPGEHVWGVVWRIHKRDMPNLDRQEDVHTGVYRMLQVTVSTPEGKQHTCRTYQMVDRIQLICSPQYKNVIVTGATATGLPQNYMEFLNGLEHNGYDGPVNILSEIQQNNNS